MLVGGQRLFTDVVQFLLTRNGVPSITVVADADSAAEVATSTRPELVLIDLDDQREARYRAARTIALADPSAVVLTVSADGQAGRSPDGLHGHLSKHVGVDGFVAALDAAVRGELVVQHTPMRRRRRLPGGATLTVREREVLQLLALGVNGREIARRLGITLNTERTHVRSLLWKLQAHSREEAVAKAARRGLIAAARRKVG
jgi:DNA-binding NarL/FixJ family response regulator